MVASLLLSTPPHPLKQLSLPGSRREWVWERRDLRVSSPLHAHWCPRRSIKGSMEVFMHRCMDWVASPAVRMGSTSLHRRARMPASIHFYNAWPQGRWAAEEKPWAPDQREGSVCGCRTPPLYLDPFWLNTAPPSRFPHTTRTPDSRFIWTLFSLWHIFMFYFC